MVMMMLLRRFRIFGEVVKIQNDGDDVVVDGV